jgi:tRNA (adenine57-N1/adenine58-N1)-methyltransferase
MAPFSPGELVLLTSQKGKKWLIKIDENAPFSCHLGTIQMRDLLSKEEGEWLETNKGAKLFLFRPTLVDYIYKLKRLTQIMYPKDLGAIVLYADIHPGDTVLESGVGSGALSLVLLRAVGEKGKVISVERREEFALLALRNLTKFYGRRPENFQLIIADIQHFYLSVMVDRVILDLPEPWLAIPAVSALLKEGGLLTSFSPNVGQIQQTFKELRSNGFKDVSTFELIQRPWIVDERRARPADRMVAHTGFITIARKVSSSLSAIQHTTLK